MRRSRLRGEGLHYSHCISRIIERRYLLGNLEKEHLLKLMRELEGFCGLKVVSYVFMSNHFHLLIEQPDRENLPKLTKDILFERLEFIYDSFTVTSIRNEFERAEQANDSPWQQSIIDRYERRMGDISQFMQSFKQRFSQWYNKRNNRRGPLWEDRFKSVLVEDDPEALITMAAYIDLNPVRAKMVRKPEDYRWSSYAAAAAGDQIAREGLGRILDHSDHVSGDDFEQRWQDTSKLYRMWLYHEGRAIEADLENGERGRAGFSDQEIEAVEAKEGQLSPPQMIRCRVRYLTDGAVFGSAAFVERVFQHNRANFGVRRQNGARRMRGGNWGKLRVIRDLRIESD